MKNVTFVADPEFTGLGRVAVVPRRVTPENFEYFGFITDGDKILSFDQLEEGGRYGVTSGPFVVLCFNIV